jgi:hypothetical protein
MAHDAGFIPFVRRYAQSWYHALATAALTALGTLTFIDRLFAVLAVGAYLLPPAVLYVRDSRLRADQPSPSDREPPDAADDSDDGGSGGASEPSSPDAGATDADSPQRAWSSADVPTDADLHDVVVADDGDGAVAVAVGKHGVVLTDGQSGWETVLTDGPGADSNTLRGVDAGAEGAVWVAGDGGAVGRIDPETGRHVDFSAPAGDTTNLSGVAVTDGQGAETVLVVDGSGRVRRGIYGDGELAWDDPVTPGSGSSIAGIDVAGGAGYLCDTNAGVYALRDRGSVERVGLDDAGGTPTDVAATDTDCLVSADDGVVHRYDGTAWTPLAVDADSIHAIAAGADWVVAGAGGGAVYERSPDATDWDRAVTRATDPLRGVGLGAGRAVAVGPAGTLVERSLTAPTSTTH